MKVTAKPMGLALALASMVCLSTLAEGTIYAGTYVADLPTASGCGRRILLELFTDDSYLFVQRYLCKPWTPAQLESGTWIVDGEDLMLSSEFGEMRFSASGTGLAYAGTRYGQAGLKVDRLD